jgi:hypothetical protein
MVMNLGQPSPDMEQIREGSLRQFLLGDHKEKIFVSQDRL